MDVAISCRLTHVYLVIPASWLSLKDFLVWSHFLLNLIQSDGATFWSNTYTDVYACSVMSDLLAEPTSAPSQTREVGRTSPLSCLFSFSFSGFVSLVLPILPSPLLSFHVLSLCCPYYTPFSWVNYYIFCYGRTTCLSLSCPLLRPLNVPLHINDIRVHGWLFSRPVLIPLSLPGLYKSYQKLWAGDTGMFHVERPRRPSAHLLTDVDTERPTWLNTVTSLSCCQNLFLICHNH